ncbi:MAG TPA: EamA family transporter [Solirubrobacteraceae bacterium]|nr:EamA family transporter [Solirubrobacteraceae bacterium]
MAPAHQPDAPAGRGIPALDPLPPVALVLLGVTSIQFGAALAATLFDRLGPAGTSALRLGFAALVLVAVWRPHPRAHSRAALRLVAAFGLALGAMNLLFYEALDRIPLGVAVTVEFLGPIGLATALSRRRLDHLWIVLAVCGVVLLASPGSAGGIDGLGLAFALGAAACWAAYIMLAERAGRLFDRGEGLAMAMVVAALIPLVPGIAQAGGALLRPWLLLSGFAVALLSSVIPYSLETEALRRMPARVFGVLMSLEPAVAALAGFIVLGQSLGARELVAIALVVAASVGVTRSAAVPRVEATLDG